MTSLIHLPLVDNWLYRQRTRAREEKARAQKSQQKKEAAARREALTPRLFNL